MDGGAWRATVHGVAKSQTRLSDFTFTSAWPQTARSAAIATPGAILRESRPVREKPCILQLPADGHAAFLHLLTPATNTALNIWVQGSLQT